jgi:acetyl esterase/lipase
VSACSALSTPAVSTPATAAATVAPSPTVEPTPVPAPTAGAFPEELVAGLRTETDVPYTEPLSCDAGECAVPLDVLAPEDGEALPTIVLLPGGPGAFNDRRYLEALAAELARQDAVVFLATYRSEATGDSNDDGLSDVRCAIRFARSRTDEFGGDRDRLVLAGHSFGSSLTLQTAANAEAETPGCLADGSGVPGAAVGLSGFTFAVDDPVDASLHFLLMSGSEDQARATGEPGADRLREVGFEAQYVELEGIDHFEIVDPAVAPEVVDRILAAAESIAP